MPEGVIMQHNYHHNKQPATVAIDTPSPNPIIVDDEHEQFVTPTEPLGTQFIAPNLPKTALISVLLVDDHALLREGLRQLLEQEQDIHIVGEAVDGFDALYKVRQFSTDIIFM